MKRSLLLDLDGTLADSLHVLRRSYERFASVYGRQPCEAEFDAINGPPLPEIARRLSQRWSIVAGAPELMRIYGALIDDEYRQVEPVEGAREILRLARKRAWTTGVVTSNSLARSGAWLARVDVAHLVDVLVTYEDVRHGKPAPDAYVLALRRAGAEASVSLAVEDSFQGVAAARAAHLPTLAVDPAGDRDWPDGVHAVRGLADIATFL